MSAHCHCFEIKKCPKFFCNTFTCCTRKSRRSAAPSKHFKKRVKEHAQSTKATTARDSYSPKLKDLSLELIDSSVVTMSKLDSEEMNQILIATISEGGVIHSINNSPRADVLMIKSHGETIQSRFPNMLCLIVGALIEETMRSNCRKQATIAIPKHGPFSVTTYPIQESGSAIGVTLIIKPRNITVTELARFIK